MYKADILVDEDVTGEIVTEKEITGNVDTGNGHINNYNDLPDKPRINGHILNTGENSLEYLGIDIPTKVSQLKNDKFYQTEIQVQNKINEAIGQITGFEFLKVDVLPDVGEKGVIYLVPQTPASTLQTSSDDYDEYIWIDTGYELIGSTRIDLSNYALKSEIPTKASQLENDTSYQTASDVQSKLNNYYNKTEVDSKEQALDDKITDSIQAVLDHLTPPTNLLINGDFQINQRGQESYEVNNNNIYTFDVWRIIASNTTTKVSRLDNGVKFENLGTGDSVFSQRMTIEEVANYTLVIKCSNIVGNVFVEIYYVGANYESHQLTNGINIINITDKNIRDISPTIKQQGSVDIEYIDLFEGDIVYPHQKEDYAIALMRCQQYLFVIKGSSYYGVAFGESTKSVNIMFYLPSNMQDTPTVSINKWASNSNYYALFLTDGEKYPHFSDISNVKLKGNILSFLGTDNHSGAQFVRGKAYVMYNDSPQDDFIMVISCEPR